MWTRRLINCVVQIAWIRYEEVTPCGVHRVRCVLGGCGYRFGCEEGTGGSGAGKRLMMLVLRVMHGARAVGWDQKAGQWGERGFL